MDAAEHPIADLDSMIPFRQAAAILGISVRTLERLVALGELPPPAKLGAKRLYPRSVLSAVIARLKEAR